MIVVIKQDTVHLLSPVFPAIFSHRPLDQIIFQTSVGNRWVTVQDHTWEDVMIKGKPGKVRIYFDLKGRE